MASKNIGSGKLVEESTEDKVRLNKQGSNSVLLMYCVMYSIPEHRSKQFLWSLDLSGTQCFTDQHLENPYHSVCLSFQ